MKSFPLPKATLLIISFLFLFGSQSIYCAQLEKTETKRILIMFSFHEGLPWEELIEDSLRTTLATKSDLHIEFNIEHTDRVRYTDEIYLQRLENLYRQKYSNPKMDLIIGIGDETVSTLYEFGEKLFPEIPIVFVTAEHGTPERAFSKPNTTSLVWGVDIKATVDLISELLPDTRHIAIVAGTSMTDRKLTKLARLSLQGYGKRFQTNYLTDVTSENLIRKVTTLPSHSVILFLAFLQDAQGKWFIPRDILSVISKQANVPVFGIVDTYIGYGIVGGSLLSAEVQGKRCANIALRILRGESPEDIIPERIPNQSIFDWRQLKRWGINQDKLPAGSIVRYQEFSVWDRYRWYIIGITSFCLLELLLIIGLLIQGKRRNRAELTMKKSEAKFASIFSNTPLPVLLLDKDRHILELNRAAHETISSSDREMKGLGLGNAFHCIHTLDNPMGCGFSTSCKDCSIRRIVSDTFQTGQPYRQVEAKLRFGNGQEKREKYLLISTAPIDIAQERQVLFYLEDITKRRNTELEFQKHRNELAHVARRAAIGEVTASLAHELNQPLTAILSSAQAAQRFLAGDPPDLNRVQSILAHIVKDDMRASEMIRKLKALLRKGELQVQPLDINKTIREIITVMKSYTSIEKVVIEMDLTPDLPSVQGDKIHLEQVLMNLILNGTEAMMTSEPFRKLIISTETHDTEMVKVSVRDFGKGLDSNNTDLIFDPFFTTKPEGMGMGLSINRSIIEAHGGRLWAENHPDCGATFYFTVPTHHRIT